MKINFVNFDDKFLKYSWSWLNDPEIKFLTNTSDFSKEDQANWYEKIQANHEYLIWGIEADSEKIGVCGLKNFTVVDCEYWGYIGNKSYWGKGIGLHIMKAMEKKAKSLKLNSIWLKVIKDNERAIKLYHKNGFVIEESKNDLIVMRKML